MNLLEIGILVFVIIEFLNILMLYWNPGSKKGNGVGVFNAYEEAKENTKVFSLIEYLINWVAGAKLIFIMIGIVVIIFGNYYTQLFTVVALIISIASFYFRLFPIIKTLDNKGEITPQGYARTLNYMILSFMAGFVIILIISLID